MVDYKNVERIRGLYAQLSRSERLRAFDVLGTQFREEDVLRKQQGFDASLEPTTEWSPTVERFLEEIKTGNFHPEFFKPFRGHPRDPLLPIGFHGAIPTFAFYDLWCQIMVRVILTARGAYDIEDLARLEDPTKARLEGRLVSFRGRLRGRVALPEEWKRVPLSKTVLMVNLVAEVWRTFLELKTHYVYSMTAAGSLSRGIENGLVIMRSIDSVRLRGFKRRIVQFSCTPLIIGNGALEIPDPLPEGGIEQLQ